MSIGPIKVTDKTTDQIIACIRPPRNTNDANFLISNIYDCAKQIYVAQNLGIECETFAILCWKVITRLNYFLTAKTSFSQMENNEIAIIKIKPLGIEYHFFVLVRINDTTFRIYSLNGNQFIEPYNVNIEDFIVNYNKYIVMRCDNKYSKNFEDNITVKLWEYLTHIDFVASINAEAERSGYSNAEELEENKFDYWEKYVEDFNSTSPEINNIQIYALGREGGKRKRSKRHIRKRNTKKRSKRHIRKRNTKKYNINNSY